MLIRRRLLHRIASGASVLTTLLAVLVGATFLVVDSGYGRAFLQTQTENIIERFLGRDYVVRIGSQKLGVDASGHLTVAWSDVEIRHVGVNRPEAQIRSATLGLHLFALLAGRLETGSLAVSGADIDLTAAPASVDVAKAVQGLSPSVEPVTEAAPVAERTAGTFLPALTGRLFDSAEQQIGLLRRRGMTQIVLTNLRLTVPVAPGGGPFVSRIETVSMDLSDPTDMRMNGTLGLDRVIVPFSASIDYDAGRIVAATSQIGPWPFGRLIPPGNPDDSRDTRPFATNSEAMLSLSIASPVNDRRRSVRLAASLGAGDLQMGRGHSRIDAVDMALDYREGDDRIAIGPNRLISDGVGFSLSGGLEPVYDKPVAQGFNGFAVAVASTDLRSTTAGAGREAVTGRLVFQGRTDLTSREMRMTRLELASGDGALTGTAAYRYGEPDARTELNLAVSRLTVEAVKAFWPFNVVVGPRGWVETNVRDGKGVIDGSIALSVPRDRQSAVFRSGGAFLPDELHATFNFAGVAAKSIDGLPDVVGASGAIETKGSDTFITINGGAFDGSPDIVLDGGLATFGRQPDTVAAETAVKLAFNVSSPVSAAIRLANAHPFDATRALPVRSEDAQGFVKGVIVADLLLGDDVPADRTLRDWSITADVSDLGLKNLPGGHTLSGTTGQLLVKSGTVEGHGEAALDGAKGMLRFSQVRAGSTVRHLKLDIQTTGAEAAKLHPIIGDIAAGPVAIEVSSESAQTYALDLDLSRAALTLPWIGWRKGGGVPARLAFAVQTTAGETSVENIALRGAGFSASGKIDIDKAGIRSAVFENIVLNPDDDVAIRLGRVENGYSLTMSGKRFDARPLLADIRNDLGARTAAAAKPAAQQFDVTVSIDQLLGFGGETLGDFSIDYAGSSANVGALAMTGKTKRGKDFAIDVSPRGPKRAIAVRTEDAGSLLDFTGVYPRMDGGRFSLDLLGSMEGGYKGKMAMKNFALIDEPRLSRIVAAPASTVSSRQSLSQAVGRDLQPGRATFDHASADIVFGRDGLRIANGIIRGPIFGSSFAGTLYDPSNQIDITGSFMPAYGLNRVFGAIPVVGQILGNGREGGLIGITYRLSGSFASPTLVVNPISAIAPGIFRNIFAYQ